MLRKHHLCYLLCLGFLLQAFAEAARPNIIFLLTDDQRDNTYAAMGHPFVDTPNVDRLLSQSMRFSNTYTAEPVCAPSRVSLLVGMHERVHGIGFTSAYDLTEEQWSRSYPALLQKAGYYTGFVGKLGVEYYTFFGKANEKFDYWWGHDGWTKFLPKNFNQPSTTPYHNAKNEVITEIMGEAMGDFLPLFFKGQLLEDLHQGVTVILVFDFLLFQNFLWFVSHNHLFR
jgi:arylsulfatase A-like enzyme